jgi:hypothetical protein
VKKLTLILLFACATAFGFGGPKYQYSDSHTDDEMNNIYETMAQALNNGGRISSGTISGLTVSTLTVTNLLTGVTFGKVAQIVYGETGTSATTTSTSFSDTGLSVTITPTSTSSRVFVIVMQSVGAVFAAAGNAAQVDVQLLRGASIIMGPYSTNYFVNIAAGTEIDYLWAHCYTDSPATTSATTYKTQFARNATNSNAITHKVQGLGTTSAIIAMEILP